MLNFNYPQAAHWLSVKKQCQAMIPDIDALLSCWVIEQLKPDRILELGPFLGGWCVLAQAAAGARSPEIWAVDTFWLHRQNQPNQLPKTAQGLSNYITNMSRKVLGRDISIFVEEGAGETWQHPGKFDLIRIDSEGESHIVCWRTLERCLDMSHDQTLVILDDVTPMHFAKMNSWFKAQEQGLLTPLIYGQYSMICCKNRQYQRKIYKELKPFADALGLKEVILPKDGLTVYYSGSHLSHNQSQTMYNSQFNSGIT